MPVNSDIFNRLSMDGTLGPQVSNSDSPETFRIYPMKIPQNPTYPLLRYQQIAADPQNTLAGESSSKNDSVQIDAYAETHEAASALADDVESAMTGAANSFKALRLARIDLVYDTDLGIYQIPIDFSIWY